MISFRVRWLKFRQGNAREDNATDHDVIEDAAIENAVIESAVNESFSKDSIDREKLVRENTVRKNIAIYRGQAACDRIARHLIQVADKRHSSGTAGQSSCREESYDEGSSHRLAHRCPLRYSSKGRLGRSRASERPVAGVADERRRNPAAPGLLGFFVQAAPARNGNAGPDDSSSGSNVRFGYWLHVAEQGCLALLSTILIAAFIGWLVYCRWRGEQRIEFEKIEIEDARFEVDPNHAASEELQLLPGIGPQLASRIEASRERHGEFSSVDDLRRVHGIGEQTVRRLTPFIAIKTSTARPSSP